MLNGKRLHHQSAGCRKKIILCEVMDKVDLQMHDLWICKDFILKNLNNLIYKKLTSDTPHEFFRFFQF